MALPCRAGWSENRIYHENKDAFGRDEPSRGSWNTPRSAEKIVRNELNGRVEELEASPNVRRGPGVHVVCISASAVSPSHVPSEHRLPGSWAAGLRSLSAEGIMKLVRP